MPLDRREAADREEADARLALTVETGPRPRDLELLTQRVTSELERGDPEENLAEAIGRAWMMGARVVLNTVQGHRICRLCGCWELEACEGGCGWAGADICTACAPNGDPADEAETCIACENAFQDGDRYYRDIEGGHLHADCAGPDRSGFVNMETGQPIGPDEPIPEPFIWSAEAA